MSKKVNWILLRIVTLTAFAVIAGCGGLTGSPGTNIGVPSGTILVADNGNGRIVAMDDITGVGWRTFGHGGNGVGMFYPSGVAIGLDGRIYIADGHNSRIVRIDNMNGDGWTIYQTTHPVTGAPVIVRKIKIDQDGAIYYSAGIYRSGGSTHIVRINDMTGAGLIYADYVDSIQDFDIDDQGQVFTIEYDAVRRYDNLADTVPEMFARPGAGSSNTDFFRSIALDPLGRIVMGTSERLSRIDDISGNGWIEVQTNRIRDIEITSDGVIYTKETYGVAMRNDITSSRQIIGSIGGGIYQFTGQYSGICIAP